MQLRPIVPTARARSVLPYRLLLLLRLQHAAHEKCHVLFTQCFCAVDAQCTYSRIFALLSARPSRLLARGDLEIRRDLDAITAVVDLGHDHIDLIPNGKAHVFNVADKLFRPAWSG